MDERVLEVQQWLNSTYGNVPTFGEVEENGRTGWNVVYGLIRALQHEFGISPLVDSFGPSTENRFNYLIGTIKNQTYPSAPRNVNYILQGAFYCKGYNPGGFTGNFYGGTEAIVREFQSDIGIEPTGEVSAKVMKALLNTDGYRWDAFGGGKSYIRELQQELNRNYAYEPGNGWHFDYIPTNGIYERATNKALIYALQVEEGIGDIANGNFGPSTIANCPTLRPGDSGPYVKILQWALACNGIPYLIESFDGIYDDVTRNKVTSFQEFMALPVTGISDMGTIKQLMTTNGDTSRNAVVCDTSFIIDDDRAASLRLNHYSIVGRYLTGNVGRAGTIVSKAMTHEELETIFSHGLRVFPIYQDGGYNKEYFTKETGTTDAFKAILAAHRLGFPSGTTIYFAVDFDAYDFEVTDLIIPYFQEINHVFNNFAEKTSLPQYNIGVYGARNTCIRVSDLGLAKYSFVSNMSTGYSGNLGFPMPSNWSFDQFHEYSILGGSSFFDIDKNGYSGRDIAVGAVNPPNNGNENPRYYACLEEWIEMASRVPVISTIRPDLLTVGFQFNIPYHIATVYNMSIDLETETGIQIDLDDGFNSHRIVNNQLVTEVSDILGEEFQGSVEADIFNTSKDLLESLAVSIKTGSIAVRVSPTTSRIEFIAREDKIRIPDTTEELTLAVKLVFTIVPKGPDSDPDSPDYSTLFDFEFSSEAIAVIAFLLGVGYTLKEILAFNPET